MTSALSVRWLLAFWLALCAATLVSSLIGGTGGLGTAADGAFVTVTVLVIAFSKAAMVMFGFMDLRRAPRPLQIFAVVWLALVLGVLLTIHRGWM